MKIKKGTFMDGAIAEFIIRYARKFKRGQKEHGGDFSKKPGMIHEAMKEALDFWSYIINIRNQVAEALRFLKLGDVDKATKILENLLEEKP